MAKTTLTNITISNADGSEPKSVPVVYNRLGPAFISMSLNDETYRRVSAEIAQAVAAWREITEQVAFGISKVVPAFAEMRATLSVNEFYRMAGLLGLIYTPKKIKRYKSHNWKKRRAKCRAGKWGRR